MMTALNRLTDNDLATTSNGGGGGLGSNRKKNCDGLDPIDFFHKKPPHWADTSTEMRGVER